jgi:hypothetical protein
MVPTGQSGLRSIGPRRQTAKSNRRPSRAPTDHQRPAPSRPQNPDDTPFAALPAISQAAVHDRPRRDPPYTIPGTPTRIRQPNPQHAPPGRRAATPDHTPFAAPALCRAAVHHLPTPRSTAHQSLARPPESASRIPRTPCGHARRPRSQAVCSPLPGRSPPSPHTAIHRTPIPGTPTRIRQPNPPHTPP